MYPNTGGLVVSFWEEHHEDINITKKKRKLKHISSRHPPPATFFATLLKYAGERKEKNYNKTTSRTKTKTCLRNIRASLRL